jgi:hypothetical protein
MGLWQQINWLSRRDQCYKRGTISDVFDVFDSKNRNWGTSQRWFSIKLQEIKSGRIIHIGPALILDETGVNYSLNLK